MTRSPRRRLAAARRTPFAVRQRLRWIARLRRRGGVVLVASPVRQVLRRMAMHVIERLRSRRIFALTIVGHRTTPAVAPRRESTASASPAPAWQRVERTTTRERVTERSTRSSHDVRTRLVERCAPPTLRVVTRAVAPARTLATTRVETRFAFPPVVRAVVRASAPAGRTASRADAHVASVAAASERRPSARADAPTGSPQAITLPPAELSRVTDFVIAQLDRRVLSYRERTGQV